ncbi:putative LRR receptor-like serine/threonine-protein kinase [Hordeum vulgare]|nr:putative LRR receptor-like serine/threonine-protein kinase [Hordeum vulgare]
MEHRVLDAAALPSSTTIEQVMPMTGTVIEPSVLEPIPNPNALFMKELCDSQASVEVARPGLGRSIDCLLMVTPMRDKQNKIGKGKSGATNKASLAA